MARNNVELQEAIEIEGANEVPVGAYDLRTKYDEPAIALDAPERGDGWGQFVLAVDEAGVATWNFADPSSSPAGPAAQRRAAAVCGRTSSGGPSPPRANRKCEGRSTPSPRRYWRSWSSL